MRGESGARGGEERGWGGRLWEGEGRLKNETWLSGPFTPSLITHQSSRVISSDVRSPLSTAWTAGNRFKDTFVWHTHSHMLQVWSWPFPPLSHLCSYFSGLLTVIRLKQEDERKKLFSFLVCVLLRASAWSWLHLLFSCTHSTSLLMQLFQLSCARLEQKYIFFNTPPVGLIFCRWQQR